MDYTNAVKKFENNWMRKKILASKNYQHRSYDAVNGLVVSNRQGRVVTLNNDKEYIEFITSSYFGLDLDKRITEIDHTTLKNSGLNLSCSRTRLRSACFDEYEQLLSKILCGANPVFFSSLHQAHQAYISMVGSGEMPGFTINNGILFIVDRLSHASIQINRGLMNQFGETVIVDFQNVLEVSNLFKKACENNLTPIAIADSVVSMGQIVPVVELLELADKYSGYVYLDDSHGTSIIGENGCGYTLHLLKNNFHPRLALATSLSKAYGAHGGAISFADRGDAEMVKKFASSYVFGQPLSLPCVLAGIESAKIHLSDEIKELQSRLWNNINFFDELFVGENIVNHKELSPIRGIMIGDENKSIDIGEKLKKSGIILTIAMYPTVERNKSILRVVMSSVHTYEQIQYLYDTLKEISPKLI